MKHPIDDYFEKGLESLEIQPSANLLPIKLHHKLPPKNKKQLFGTEQRPLLFYY